MKKLKHTQRKSQQGQLLRTSLTTIAALILSTNFTTAHAQQSEATPSAAKETQELDSIVVIGSSRRDNNASLNASSEIKLITPTQLKETGAETLNEALSKLDPSFNFAQGQNAVKGQGVRAASLRGVSPAYTLILVNGKRRNQSAQLSGTDPWPAATVVDLNVIPISAVSRIEVLKDGASAQYGSDAIAGVINIVLKNANAGGNINARVGGYTDGGGFTKTINAWKGFDLNQQGSITASIDWLDSAQVNRTSPDWRQDFPTGDPRNTNGFQPNWRWGQSERSYVSALVNGEYDLGNERQLYGYINYSDKSSNNPVNPERVVKTNNNANPPTTANLISQTADLAIYPNGYQGDLTYTSKDTAAVAGYRTGNEDNGKLDFALSWGKNETGRTANNTANPAWGAASPTSFYLGSWKSDQTTATVDYVKNAPVSFLDKPLIVNAGVLARKEDWGTGNLADPASYSGGAYAGWTVGQYYTKFPNLIPTGVPTAAILADTTALALVASSGSGIQPVDAYSVSRNSKALYLGTEADLTSKLQVGITGRIENTSDFGTTKNGKINGRYDVNPNVAFRGTLSTGFHAPSLAELGTQTTAYTGTLVNGSANAQSQGQTRLFRPNDPIADKYFGAKPLQPEKSDTVSLGAVFKDGSNTSLTVDAYVLKIDNVITSSQSLTGTDITNAFNTAGLNGFTTASYYLNAWDSRTQGLDLVAKHDLDKFLSGKLELTAELSLNNTEIENVHYTTTTTGGTVHTVIAPAQVRDAETGVPKNKLILTSRYTQGNWVVLPSLTRYGAYRYNANGSNGIADQVFSPETYVDLDVSYKLTKAARLEFGAKDLFNRYPDPYNAGNRQSGVNRYSFIAPNGASGRFVYTGLNYSL